MIKHENLFHVEQSPYNYVLSLASACRTTPEDLCHAAQINRVLPWRWKLGVTEISDWSKSRLLKAAREKYGVSF